MDKQLILQIGLLVIFAIAIIIIVAWQIKKRGLKDFIIDMIIKAEEMYNKGENEEKINYVIDKVIAMLPLPLQFFITRNAVRNLVQNAFDNIKKTLDYVPKKVG